MASDLPNVLGPDALAGVRVGVSVSESADLLRLGLTEVHLELVLAEVARVVIRAGGTLVYGGHLREGGYTTYLMAEVDRYGRTDRPLELVVPWAEHRRMSLTDLKDRKKSLALKGRFTYLDERGEAVDAEADREETAALVDEARVPPSLTALRAHLAAVTDARVLIGGKEQDFAGVMPGVVEEAICAIRASQPLYLVGGFGGAAASVAEIVCALPERWPPPKEGHAPGPWVGEVRSAASEDGWKLTSNGLDDIENKRLATTHRPSEVAGLVATGLRRTFGAP